MHHDKPVDPRLLGGLELFAGLPDGALAEIRDCARVLELSKDAIIFSQEEVAQHSYALIAGRVRISQSDEEGAQLLVRFIGAGEMFGTVALFAGGTYPATAVTTLDSLIISWPEATLLKLIGRYPTIAVNIVKVVGTRLREMQERLREVATQRVHQRMARVLLRLHAQAETSGNEAFPLTRQDMADMCGTTLHTASRVLTEWQKRGLLTTNRQLVTLRGLEDIQRIADEPTG